jgi:predicted unusual protein kinase regulating ubiquinone biosynthesis (AarF/ABC1/UbiB family)
MEIANRTIYQFPFKLPKNLVLYIRMLSILEGVCLKLDSKFRFIKILGSLLEEEGLVQEAYREELKESIEKIGEALDAAIELAPLMKNYFENKSLEEMSRKRQSSGGRGFSTGVLAGVGAFGTVASLFYLGDTLGKFGLGISLLLLVAAVVGSRG